MSSDASKKSTYQGLSRAYRPQTFASVVGQESIVTTLKNALRLGKTAQAYLFCGTRGTGKTTLARILAKALNCQNLTKDFEPCDTCPSCLEISQGKNLNIFEIDGASHRGIDDMRQLNETVVYAPTASGCKVFIIDEAHMLTKEAFNALLKTLEEPPPNVKFFLATTEPHKIPPTIISRCQRFDLQRISSVHIAEKLTNIVCDLQVPYEEAALYKLASLSDGSLRVAESLLDQILCFSKDPLTEKNVAESLAILPDESFFSLDRAFAAYDLSFAFTFASSIFSSGKDLSYFLECLLEHYRNILALQLKIPTPELHKDKIAKYQESAAIYSQEQTLYLLEYLLEGYQSSHKTPFKRVSLEMILLHILKSRYRVSAADLVCRLQEMQKTPFTPPPAKMEKEEKLVSKTEISLPSSQPIIEKIVIQEPELAAAPSAPPALAPPPPPPLPIRAAPPTKNTNTQARHETLMRFASVELEGLLTKES